jgi:hypothetical protein
MDQTEVGGRGILAGGEGPAEAATAPARWLLGVAADGGVPLTQTHALARALVREAAERWPQWWDADLFGPPHREADLAVLEGLHEGLRRLRLVRRRGRKLYATARGRELAADPVALLRTLATDLGGGDPFTEMVADEIVNKLARNAPALTTNLWPRHSRRPFAEAGAIQQDARRGNGTYRGWSATYYGEARRTD